LKPLLSPGKGHFKGNKPYSSREQKKRLPKITSQAFKKFHLSFETIPLAENLGLDFCLFVRKCLDFKKF
jgi:hypothetical protein